MASLFPGGYMRVLLVSLLMLVFTGSAFAMDDESYDSDKKLSAYETIIINDFSTKDVKYTNIDGDEAKEMVTLLPQMLKNITDGIVRIVKKETKFKNIVVNGQELTKSAVRLEGKLVSINGGVGGMKMLGPFTPKKDRTSISFSGRFVEVETGKQLGTFSEVIADNKYAAMKQLRKTSEDIGEKVGDFYEKNYN